MQWRALDQKTWFKWQMFHNLWLRWKNLSSSPTTICYEMIMKVRWKYFCSEIVQHVEHAIVNSRSLKSLSMKIFSRSMFHNSFSLLNFRMTPWSKKFLSMLITSLFTSLFWWSLKLHAISEWAMKQHEKKWSKRNNSRYLWIVIDFRIAELAALGIRRSHTLKTFHFTP